MPERVSHRFFENDIVVAVVWDFFAIQSLYRLFFGANRAFDRAHAPVAPLFLKDIGSCRSDGLLRRRSMNRSGSPPELRAQNAGSVYVPG